MCQCGFVLGGSFTPRHVKKPKLDVPACTEVVSGPWSIYSCQTSTHDDRCLVIKDQRDGRLNVSCEHHDCKQKRAVMVNSSCSSDFTCPHVESIQSAAAPLSQHSSIPGLQEYKCSASVKENLVILQNSLSSSNLPLAVAVSPTMFCVYGQVTSNTPVGYCHVQVKDDSVRCCSKDCKTFFAKAKQHKAKSICLHVHILLSLGLLKTDNGTEADTILPSTSLDSSASPSSLEVQGSSSASISTNDDPALNSVSRISSISLNMKRSLPLHIPRAIIMQSHYMDVNGWPSSLAPSCTTCGLCNSTLSKERGHPGQRGESLLLTNLQPFRPIKILVKFCENPNCQAMHQVFPYDLAKLHNLQFY